MDAMAERVAIRHPQTRGVHVVNASAVTTWAKRGWVPVTANDPKPTVLEAAEALGVAVDPGDTRTAIVEQIEGAASIPSTPTTEQ